MLDYTLDPPRVPTESIGYRSNLILNFFTLGDAAGGMFTLKKENPPAISRRNKIY